MKLFKCFRKPQGKESYDIPTITEFKTEYSDIELRIHEEINMINSVTLNDTLSSIAMVHSKYMVSKKKVSHENFNIRTAQAFELLGKSKVGETVSYGYGTAIGVINGWFASEGHRKVMTNTDYTQIGVSVEQDSNNRNYITVLYK